MSAFKTHTQECSSIFGTEPTLELVYENHDYPFAHEAGVFIAQDNTLFVTSNQFEDPKSGKRNIRITRVCLPIDRTSRPVTCEEVDAPDVPMAAPKSSNASCVNGLRTKYSSAPSRNCASSVPVNHAPARSSAGVHGRRLRVTARKTAMRPASSAAQRSHE